MPLRDAARANLYHVLGLEPGASPDALRVAYARQLKRHHPDTRGHLPARLDEVREAYHILSDPGRRAEYDRTLFAEERAHRAYRHRLHWRLDGYDRRHPAPAPALPGRWWLTAAAALIAAGAGAAVLLVP